MRFFKYQKQLRNENYQSNKLIIKIGIAISIIVFVIFCCIYIYTWYRNLEWQRSMPDIKKQESQGQETVNQQNSQFKNWQIYQNKEYGFEVKYPKGFYLEVPKNQDQIIINTLSPNDPLRQSSIGLGSLFSIKIEKDKTLTEEVKKIEEANYEDFFKEIIQVDAKRAIQITYTGIYGGEKHIITLLENNNLLFVFNYIESYPEFNQILSTFKFTK